MSATILTQLDHRQLHSRVSNLMQRERECTLAILDHLVEINRRKLYCDRGHSSLFAYVTDELGYSTASAVRRIGAVRAITLHPPFRDMIATRETTLSALSAVSRDITADNAGMIAKQLNGATIKDAQLLSSELRGGVIVREKIRPVAIRSPEQPTRLHIRSGCDSSARPVPNINVAPKPSSIPGYALEFAIDAPTMALVERAMALASNRPGGKPTTAELFAMSLEVFLDKYDPERREARRKKRAAGKSKDKVGSRALPQATRDRVFVRDGGRCTFRSPDNVRCNARHHLHVDHIVPRANGGSNAIDNLRLLCATHNRYEARRLLGA